MHLLTKGVFLTKKRCLCFIDIYFNNTLSNGTVQAPVCIEENDKF